MPNKNAKVPCFWILLGALCLITSVVCAGQAPGEAVRAFTQFEVVSFRLAPKERGNGWGFSSPGEVRFSATNASLKLLIQKAYGVEESQIMNAPSWVDTQRYDITAIPPDGFNPFTDVELRPLLQKMLADRLHLSIHKATQERRGYTLVLAKGAMKLKPGGAAPAAGKNVFVSGSIGSDAMSMQTLTVLLTLKLGVPVIDKTALLGNYQVELMFAPDSLLDSPLPSIFTALQEQLGLKLDPQKVMADVVVVDHVDRIPTEN
jgi:uncharacterized protein (TIGR03435 family)